LRRRGGGLFLKDARQELGRWALPSRVCPEVTTFLDRSLSLDDDDGADLALARMKTTSERLESTGRAGLFWRRRQSAKRVELLKSLADLELEKDDQEDHEHLPQNLEDPRGQEEAPGLSNGEDDTKGKQSDKGLERLGAPEPKIKVVGHHGREKESRRPGFANLL